jgi:hypothetical protein
LEVVVALSKSQILSELNKARIQMNNDFNVTYVTRRDYPRHQEDVRYYDELERLVNEAAPGKQLSSKNKTAQKFLDEVYAGKVYSKMDDPWNDIAEYLRANK